MIAIVLSLLASLYLAIGIGANDETMAPVAGSGVLSLNSSIILGAIMASLGAVLLGKKVENTLGSGLLYEPLGTLEIVIVLMSVAVFLTVASLWGLPVSTTHSTVGSVVGVGIAKWGVDSLSRASLIRVSIGWIVSPLIGLVGAYLLNQLFRYFQKKYIGGLGEDLRFNRRSALLLLFWICLTEFSRGANDVANVTAFLIPLDFSTPLIIRLVTSLGLAVGLIFIGKRVVRRVGTGLVSIDPVSGLAAQIVVSLTLLGGTLLGLPISGTHVLIGSFVGLGVSDKRYIDVSDIREIMVAWLGTFIGTFFLSYLGHYLLVFTGMQ